MGDGVLEASQWVGGSHEAPGALRRHDVEREGERRHRVVGTGAALGAVGVGPGQADLTVPQGSEVHRHFSGHADEGHGAPRSHHGDGVRDRLGAADAVDHHVRAATRGWR